MVSAQMINSADYIVPVEIESQTHNVYVIKRPGVDNFLKQMGEIYEVVVFTASLSKVSTVKSLSAKVRLMRWWAVRGPGLGYAGCTPSRQAQAV